MRYNISLFPELGVLFLEGLGPLLAGLVLLCVLYGMYDMYQVSSDDGDVRTLWEWVYALKNSSAYTFKSFGV